ncbi:MAG: EAL domain-containing protein [Oleispira sp.]|nr:EAL domain-containing protein [Oleispira sp.]MBL4881341.1 EAL domain-containing protein [Oleispira sp.]
MDCIIISEDDKWAQQLEAKLSQANIQVARHSSKSYPTTEDTLYLVDANGRQPDIADCGKRILLFTDQPIESNVLQLPRTHAPRWLLNHLGIGCQGLPLTWGASATEGQLIVNEQGIILSANEVIAVCLSGPAEYWQNKTIDQIFPDLTDKAHYSIRRQLNKLCQQGQPCSGQLLAAKNRLGRSRHLEVCASKLVGGRFLLNCRDVTQRTSSHKAMRHKARFDALTGLANRQLLMDRLRMALARGKRFQRQLAVMYIDLDHFKPINDTWGHAAGDAILREASLRMKDAVREIDTVARLGGDEFIIVIEDLKDHRDAGVIAKHVLNALAKVFCWQQHEFYIGCSIGISISSDDKEDANSLIEKADLALYRAKNKGRQRFEFCTPELTAQARYKLVLQDGLQQALQENQLQLYFQPIANTGNNRIEGAEVLLRWLHPKVGMVPPKDFIPLLEQTGLIIPVGEWLIEKACQQWVHWKATGLLDEQARMSINISNCQFASKQLISCIQRITSKLDMPANTLALEINEELLLSDPNRLQTIFEQLNYSGVDIIIDDFGLGNTSIHSLSQFNLTAIKLEKPLIESLTNSNGKNSLSAFSDLAHSLNIAMIAEGIDDSNQLETLAKSGIDSYQGYSLCAPMDAINFEQFIRKQNEIENKLTIIA